MTHEIQIIIDFAIGIFFFITIILSFAFGVQKSADRELRCTKTVKGKILKQKTHKFFGSKYFDNTISYSYDDKEYTVQKGLFGNKYEGVSEIDVHVDPNKPNDCYLIPLKERCNFKKSK